MDDGPGKYLREPREGEKDTKVITEYTWFWNRAKNPERDEDLVAYDADANRNIEKSYEEYTEEHNKNAQFVELNANYAIDLEKMM